MGGAGEEVEGLSLGDLVFLAEELDVAGLGDGVAGEIDDGGWGLGEEAF